VRQQLLKPSDVDWPTKLNNRLGSEAPRELAYLGPRTLLSLKKTSLFCSRQTPGSVILRAHDATRHLRERGLLVVSGFHSQIEKDCLTLLLRGRQPIIICVARALKSMRIPSVCRDAFNAGRILFVSPFSDRPTRVTIGSAVRRNEVVAALADEAYVFHLEGSEKTEMILTKLRLWGVPIHCGQPADDLLPASCS
jgi:predicted Rossmann fold nucleotide-binding protein DprA/Smf involved in DNA uptake